MILRCIVDYTRESDILSSARGSIALRSTTSNHKVEYYRIKSIDFVCAYALNNDESYIFYTISSSTVTGLWVVGRAFFSFLFFISYRIVSQQGISANDKFTQNHLNDMIDISLAFETEPGFTPSPPFTLIALMASLYCLFHYFLFPIETKPKLNYVTK